MKFFVEHPYSQNQAYGRRLVADLRKLSGTIHRREEYASDATFRQALTCARNALLWDAILEAPSTREVKNLAKRFFQHTESHFRFISEPEIEPTNNLAEQVLRFVAIQRRLTQGNLVEESQDALEVREAAVAASVRARGLATVLLE